MTRRINKATSYIFSYLFNKSCSKIPLKHGKTGVIHTHRKTGARYFVTKTSVYITETSGSNRGWSELVKAGHKVGAVLDRKTKKVQVRYFNGDVAVYKSDVPDLREATS